jgi:hypothetical protein
MAPLGVGPRNLHLGRIPGFVASPGGWTNRLFGILLGKANPGKSISPHFDSVAADGVEEFPLMRRAYKSPVAARECPKSAVQSADFLFGNRAIRLLFVSGLRHLLGMVVPARREKHIRVDVYRLGVCGSLE